MIVKKLAGGLLVAMSLVTGTCLNAQTNTATAATASADDDFAKKKVEIKLMEVIPTDSVPASELVNRAGKWFKQETIKFKITNAATGADKAECIAAFPTKPKELNPQVDYTGRITMKVLIECKTGKYRYTVSDIRHVSKNGKSNGGSIDNEIPECGSMGMTDIVWKKLRGEALHDASVVIADLKEAMNKSSTEEATDEW